MNLFLFLNRLFSKCVFLSVQIFLVLFHLSESGANETLSEEKFISKDSLPCEEKSTECYDQLYNYFSTFPIYGEDSTVRLVGQSSVRLYNNKTPYVILSTHGLFESAKQMGQTSEELFKKMNYNSIAITLPGHSLTPQKYIAYADHNQWLHAFREAFQVASLLGDKVILVGQSAGALLSIYGALQFPSEVGGLVLIEPALVLNIGPEILGCFVGRVIKDSAQIELLLSLMNISTNYKHLNLFFGCEVSKMISTIFNTGNNTKSIEKNILLSIKEIKVPVLFINNLSDKVVSGSFNKKASYYFSGPIEYIEIDKKESINHGWYISNPNSIPSYLNVLNHFFSMHIKNQETPVHLSSIHRSDSP